MKTSDKTVYMSTPWKDIFSGVFKHVIFSKAIITRTDQLDPENWILYSILENEIKHVERKPQKL